MSVGYHILPKMVFPSTKMEAVNKLITEGSLTRLINKLLDTDSYIIPPNDLQITEYINIPNFDDRFNYIKVENFYTELEFLLSGYYFNLGTIQGNIINTIKAAGALQNGYYKLSAKIFIDESSPEYPELAGENLLQSTSAALYTNIKNTTIEQLIGKNKKVVSIDFFNGDTKAFSGVLDDNGYIKPEQSSTTVPSSYTVSITYYDYSNIINIYLSKVSSPEELPELEDGAEIIGDIRREQIDLLYLKIDSNSISSMYFPVHSFVKFQHQSIGSIDGGIL